MSDTTPAPAETPAESTDTTPSVTGALQGLFASMNPLYALLSAATSSTVAEVIKDPTESLKDVKKSIGSFMIDSSLIVLGIVAIIFAIVVAISQDEVASKLAKTAIMAL